MILRKATQADVPTVLLMIKKFHASCSYKDIPFSEAKTLTLIANAANDHPDNYCMVADKDGVVVGILAASLHAPLFSEESVAVELGWWVEPEYRNGKAGLGLIRDFEKWAASKNVRVVQLSTLGTTDPTVEDFFKRIGYYKVETTWHKRLR